MKTVLSSLQRIGRALMLPIAVLPVAALLLRLGQPDLLNIAAMAAAGNAIFSNLGLLFAIGVAVGLARENHGAAGLASVVGYLVATKGAEVLIPVPADALANFHEAAVALADAAYRAKELGKLSVPVGILSGLIAGALYNRYSDIRLPAYLAFFGGRRFVPIASGCAGLVLAVCFGYGWPVLESGMDAMSQAVLGSQSIGLFAYGVLNRALIVTGLHHILNNIAWFILGDYNGVTGDLKRFFAGDPTAGAFMSGFFPVMMFGLPAACLAMYRSAHLEKRKAVGGLLMSMALTSFLTGVTEPIEFSFMFLAPVLYAIHALLTGVAMVVMNLFSVRLGFGFSAGLFDYVLNYSRSTRPLWLIPIGMLYFGLYYGLFRYVIARFDLKTPGREVDDATVANETSYASPAQAWVHALGGASNLVQIDACTTRLRLMIADQSRVNESELRRLGARGFVRPSSDTLQVVVGPIADQLAGDIRQAARSDASYAQSNRVNVEALAAALGGSKNLQSIDVHSTRLGIRVGANSQIDSAAIKAAGARTAVQVSESLWHVIVGPTAEAVASQLRASGSS
ncbi:MAG TPA: N-acetylglucosamine-specific PTS transporter subunit IIBC [Steroidobacteraceae bacterium]|nr:N-acetylglucosamine-specific PTS transporter subunit IIBC [Steroidobacteraceae bacterium]